MNPAVRQIQDDDLQQLHALLEEATAAIAPAYFLLPVATPDGAAPKAQYRERVYAYQLYHELQFRWPETWRYSLAGEPDKGGHPIFRRTRLARAKPDLIVHVPQSMEHNLAVIEIKALRARGSGQERAEFQKDIRKLIAFRGPVARYTAAFFLVFGNGIHRMPGYIRDLQQQGVNADELNGVTLLHHEQPNRPAVIVSFDGI